MYNVMDYGVKDPVKITSNFEYATDLNISGCIYITGYYMYILDLVDKAMYRHLHSRIIIISTNQ